VRLCFPMVRHKRAHASKRCAVQAFRGTDAAARQLISDVNHFSFSTPKQ
jgi:hypothetical protein